MERSPPEAGSSPAPSSGEPADSLDVGAANLRRRLVRGGTLTTLGLLMSQAISLISFIVLARLAPPATFGAYAAASILVGASMLFTEAGMQAAVIQRADRLQERSGEV